MKNEEKLRRMLYLTEYGNKVDKKLLSESVDALIESKQTESQAEAILTKNGVNNPDQLIQQFKNFDRTQNQKLLPIIAGSYVQHKNVNELRTLFLSVSEFVNSNKIPPPELTADGEYKVKDKVFKDFLKFSEYIHGLEAMSKGRVEMEGKINTDVDEPPIWEGNGIAIYDGNDVGKCIKYTTGGATGKRYGFCIGQPANTMWQSYRDTKGSTFYYVIDSNRDLNDPLHIVVFDNTKYGIELTDATNSTGTIAEYGSDPQGYVDYLKSKGAPVDELINKPKTPEEEAEAAKLGSRNEDLQWFKDLSYEEKSKYIGRGHLLGDKQFDYLWQFRNDKGGFKLLHQYVSTGQAIPEEQFNTLVGSEAKKAA